ncbi:MAG: hypothetical protein L0191_07610, partial [Acidobacteria bacterium]|nr:hypothetical protein [Acidobacteriota bacterium]
MRIEEGARRILTGLSSLRSDLAGFRESFEVMGKHLLNAARNLEDARRRMEKVEWKLEQVESLEEEVVSENPAIEPVPRARANAAPVQENPERAVVPAPSHKE